MTGNGDYVEEFKAKNAGYSQVMLPLEKRKDLQGNFLAFIRQNGTLCCNAELGAAAMVGVKMALEILAECRPASDRPGKAGADSTTPS